MKNFFINFTLILSLVLLPLGPASAQTGNHTGEQSPLQYRIEYLSPSGVTTADAGGITFTPFGCCVMHTDEILPARYFGDYPLYFTESVLHFRVVIKNNSHRTYRNLRVEATQEFLNTDGGVGVPIGSDPTSSWTVDKLGAFEELVLSGSFAIPSSGESGIDQTHLRILRGNERATDTENGEVILDDTQAGLWCPL